MSNGRFMVGDASLARREEMSMRSQEAATGAKPGEASVSCVGERFFPIDRKDTALVIIDMQTDFLTPDGRIGCHYQGDTLKTRNAIPGVERLLKACRAAGMTIAHSRSHRYGAIVRDDLVGIGDEGYEFYPSCKPLPDEIVVDKWTFGAFASTPLEVELRARGVERILLCGVLTNVCIFATASQAVDRYFRVCLVQDACAAFEDHWHSMAVKLMSDPQTKKGHNAQVGLYFAEVTTLAQAESALAPLAKLQEKDPVGEPPEKRRKVECPAFASVARRNAVSARSKAVITQGPAPGDATIACRSKREFPIARSDTALVIIDMQTDFLSPEGRIGMHYKDTPVRAGLEGVERLLAACRRAGFTIAHSRSHRYGATLRDDLVGKGDEGYEFYPTCKPMAGEIVVDKWTFGAFASTPLEDELRTRGVERIMLCGILTNVCIFATAVQAVDRFFRVCMAHDACAAFDQEWHDNAIRLIGEPQTKKGHNGQVGLYFAEITSVRDVEEALAPLEAATQ